MESGLVTALGAAGLAAEVRGRLGRAPQLGRWPLVSIVVINRDGASHLRRLLPGLTEKTEYPELELVLVDNGSSDDSLDFLRSVEAPFPISIVANNNNESFSNACNQGSELSCGELLLFLNNDTEPFEEGWLRELVACVRTSGAGIAGPTLIQPSESSPYGFAVQHRAMRLVEDSGLLRADLYGRGSDPLGEDFGGDAQTPIAAGACMLIERELFELVGSFTQGYFYGGEDIDLGLKVLEQGRSIVCSGRSLLIHRHGSTRTMESDERQLAIDRGNRRLLWERWGPRVRREYQLDRLDGGGFWASSGSVPPSGAPTREEILALAFCLKSSEAAAGGADPLEILQAELRRRGHRCTVLRSDDVDELAGLDCDVTVHLRGPARYVPVPGRLNVLWCIGHLDAIPQGERDRYDLTFTGEDVGALIDAVLERAEELALPTRLPVAPPD